MLVAYPETTRTTALRNPLTTRHMIIEVWSDIACPFCYIGKHRLEQALVEFGHRDAVRLQWKSFQLNPDLHYTPGDTLNSYLARHKGWSEKEARSANQHVTQMARQAGLTFDLERALPVNTFKAHVLLQLASASGRQNELGEALFSAYFKEGRNVSDESTLIDIATKVGLPGAEVTEALGRSEFADAVARDVAEAQQLGIRGVPFFVFNRKYAVSGAQPKEVFAQALNTAWNEEAQGTMPNGESCDVNGVCN